jgi:hypothetical protein
MKRRHLLALEIASGQISSAAFREHNELSFPVRTTPISIARQTVVFPSPVDYI